MKLLKYSKIYLITLCVFLVIDSIWLGYLAKDLYKQQIGHLLSSSIRWEAALSFYLIYIGGMIFFAVSPALFKKSWKVSLINGAVFGFMCYATYDLTNLATLKGWPLKIVFVDLFWGTFISAMTSCIAYFVITKGKKIFE